MTCRKRRDDVKTVGSRYCGINFAETCLRAEWHPALRWPESVGRRLSGTWEPWLRCKRRSSSGRPVRARVRMRSRGAEQPVVAGKSRKREGAKISELVSQEFFCDCFHRRGADDSQHSYSFSQCGHRRFLRLTRPKAYYEQPAVIASSTVCPDPGARRLSSGVTQNRP